MENLISAFDIVEILAKGQKVSISTNNAYSSTEYIKVHEFLDFVHAYQILKKKQAFFKRETFAKNRYYFSVINDIQVNIETKNSH